MEESLNFFFTNGSVYSAYHGYVVLTLFSTSLICFGLIFFFLFLYFTPKNKIHEKNLQHFLSLKDDDPNKISAYTKLHLKDQHKYNLNITDTTYKKKIGIIPSFLLIISVGFLTAFVGANFERKIIIQDNKAIIKHWGAKDRILYKENLKSFNYRIKESFTSRIYTYDKCVLIFHGKTPEQFQKITVHNKLCLGLDKKKLKILSALFKTITLFNIQILLQILHVI